MDNYKKILQDIPSILSSSDDLEGSFDNILSKLKNVVSFEYAYVCYLNAGSIDLRFRKLNGRKDILDPRQTFFEIPENNKKSFYCAEPVTFKFNDKIAKLFNFEAKKNFLISKLLISETVFGFILLARDMPFNEQECELAKIFCSLASYSIKDSELSNVFKLQLKALQDNIIEKFQAHETIKKQNEKILEADKIKSDFMANTSHELRTPLNAIIGFSEVLSRQLFGPLNEKQSEYINDIHVSGLHLLGMINEILEISKIEAKAIKFVPSNFDLKLCFTEVINIVHPLADKKKISIIKNIPKDIEIYADYQKVQQILFNLLSNSIKFTKEGGHIEAGYETGKKNVTIYIKDDGIGIDEKYHSKIFEKFTQIHNIYCKNESSTGLGLAITKELTELHGGTVRFESELEKGTTFFITLPIKNKVV